jgi:hypothetical protein
MLGLVLLFQGELKAARSALERAVADYIPERTAIRNSASAGTPRCAQRLPSDWRNWLLGNGCFPEPSASRGTTKDRPGPFGEMD